jgi:hypothetical protein
VKGGVGQAIIDQIPKAAGAIASVLAKTFGAAAPIAANIFLKSFLNADAWGKLLIGGVLAKKLGTRQDRVDRDRRHPGRQGAGCCRLAEGSDPGEPDVGADGRRRRHPWNRQGADHHPARRRWRLVAQGDPRRRRGRRHEPSP